jgi:hypothetical protein
LLDRFVCAPEDLGVGNFGGIPRSAKQRAAAISISIPKNVSHTRLRTRARNLIVEVACVRGQIDQERLRICAPLAQQPLGCQILFVRVFALLSFLCGTAGTQMASKRAAAKRK